MKVLAIVQCLNEADSARGFVVNWMEKLSEKVDELVILTLEKRQEISRANVKVYSLGKENYNGFGCKLYYLFQWHKKISHIAEKENIDLIFTHMTPIYSVLAYPYFVFKKVPIITWFLYPKLTLINKIAYYVSSKVVSATTDSYPYKKDKLITIGHGINTDYFNNRNNNLNNKAGYLVLLSIGRISAIKDHLTLLKATDYIKNKIHNLRVLVVGNPVSNRDVDYKNELVREIKKIGIEGMISFQPAISIKNLPDLYKQCSVFINMTKTGSLDKVVLEAVACGKPVLVASKSFSAILGSYSDKLIYSYGSHVDLGNKLLWLFNLSNEERNKMCEDLQKFVLESYSVDALMSRLIKVFALELKK